MIGHQHCHRRMPHYTRYFKFLISRHFSLLEKKKEFLQHRKVPKLKFLYTFNMLKN